MPRSISPPNGAPLMCLSALAEHTQNLRRDPRASLLVCQPADAGDPLASARVTLVGSLVPHDPSEDEREAHLGVHPHAGDYIGLDDFSWWRFEVSSVRYIGGFGFMGWATGDEFAAASADPIIPHAASMIAHLNADHADACAQIVRRLANEPTTTAARVSHLDRYGMTLDAWTDSADSSGPDIVARVAFAEPLESPREVRAASVELVRRANATTQESH